jgi:hypothetical protein
MPTQVTSVTAQDFFEAVQFVPEGGIDAVNTIPNFDALFSQARQQALQEGRKQGLKEMDDALNKLWLAEERTSVADDVYKKICEQIDKLRSEYQDSEKV